MKQKLRSILLLLFVLVAIISFSFCDFSVPSNAFSVEVEKKENTIIINGKRSNHNELRKITPSKIKEVNFISNPKEISKKGRKTDAIIEVTLFNPNRLNPEIPDTLQVKVNGMKIKDFESQSTPLLVFDERVIQDQNPNNIDTRQMKWIDFYLTDSVTNKYGEKAMIGLIQAQLIYPEGFVDCDVMPEFPGGEGALRTFIKNNLVYPEVAIKDSLEGKVYVTFVLSKTGKVENAQIARGVHPVMDKEAFRVVSSIPDWKPGEQFYLGKFGTVKCTVSYTIPVNFKLSDIQQKP